MAGPNVSHRKYGPGEEPTGYFDMAGLQYAESLSIVEGRHKASIEAVKGDHPGEAFFRARVPLAYSSEDEVYEWRAYWEKCLRELLNTEFDPREAFDGTWAFRPHAIVYQQFNNRDLLALAGELLCNKISAKALPDLCQPIETPRKPGRIRVGFISTNLKSSSCAPWTLAWMRGLGEDFETYAFNIGETEDMVSKEFQSLANHYYHMPFKATVPADARAIKALDLDVLIYLDLGTAMRNQQLATFRLARVQCATWGGPETSGLPTIDYFISGDYMEAENAQDHHTEKLVRLPGAGASFEQERIPASNLTRQQFGAGEGQFILCLQIAPKFAPQWDYLYKAINEATGQPVVFKDPPLPGPRRILKERLEKAGVKARYLPRLNPADYRALIREADVILDTPGYNGGITTVDALEFGTPVVTLPTEFQRGRQCSAFLKAANVSGLIAKDAQDYVALVVDEERRTEAMKGFQPDRLWHDQSGAHRLAAFLREVSGQA